MRPKTLVQENLPAAKEWKRSGTRPQEHCKGAENTECRQNDGMMEASEEF